MIERAFNECDNTRKDAGNVTVGYSCGDKALRLGPYQVGLLHVFVPGLTGVDAYDWPLLKIVDQATPWQKCFPRDLRLLSIIKHPSDPKSVALTLALNILTFLIHSIALIDNDRPPRWELQRRRGSSPQYVEALIDNGSQADCKV